MNALLDRLTDNSLEVKHDALGAIHALILKQGQGICKELYRKNIVKLLETVVAEVIPRGFVPDLAWNRTIRISGSV